MDQGLGTKMEVDSQAVWPPEGPSSRRTKALSLVTNRLPPSHPVIDGGQTHRAPTSPPAEDFFFC